MFLSTYEKQLDGKRRLLIPQEFRTADNGAEHGVFCFFSMAAATRLAFSAAFAVRCAFTSSGVSCTRPPGADICAALCCGCRAGLLV